MEITAHAGARPSHSYWQGQIVSLSGRQGYLSLSDIGYGTGDGFKGWNCRHDWFPYAEGSTRMYSAKDLERLNDRDVEFPDGTMHTYYEAEQKQRYYERKIRKTKRTLSACDEAINNLSDERLLNDLKKEFEKYSVKLKRQEAELKYFCSETELLPDNARAQVYGFGRSTAQKAVGSAKKHYNIWSKEHNINNIKKLADYYNVKYNESERYALLKTYVSSVDRGMMSPLTGFDLYEKYHNRVENELIGLTTAGGIKIKSQSKHFLERVFGTKEDPTHENKPRNGVDFDDIKNALLKDKFPRYSKKNNSYTFCNEKCQVSVNLQGNLIQTNPKTKVIK